MENQNYLVSAELIERKIFLIRGQKVMLDRDLAALYRVETKILKQAVRRNIKRFPDDFMFVLSNKEFTDWRSQFVTSKSDKMGLRYAPMAFTEQGVAMLSSVLNSEGAIEVNIQIMRAFVRLRQMLLSHADLARKLKELEQKYDSQFKIVFDAIRALMAEEKVGLKMNLPRNKIEKISRILTSLHTPTISNLADEGWVAMEVIIDEKTVRDIIPELKRAGAQGIVEYPLNKVIP